MSLRYFLDEDISPAVAAGLRAHGVDADSAYDAGRANRRISDRDQLAHAAGAGRVLVTYNRADYQQLDSEWREAGRTHAGIIWCSDLTFPRRDVGAVIRALNAVAGQYESLAGLCLPLRRAP
jgi:hypothetical protein